MPFIRLSFVAAIAVGFGAAFSSLVQLNADTSVRAQTARSVCWSADNPECSGPVLR
jgi:hypothetical protein